MSDSSVGGVRSPSEPDIRQDGDGAAPRDIYKRVQSGGDIPAKGLQKPAPEKPKGKPLNWLLSGVLLTLLVYLNVGVYFAYFVFLLSGFNGVLCVLFF